MPVLHQDAAWRDVVQAQVCPIHISSFFAELVLWRGMAGWVAPVLDRLLRKQYTCALLQVVSQLVN